MPFDGSGNFSRLYSWQSDRDNGIRILASKMDGEFDNFAAGMNQVFFRNGLVPMSGSLNLGQNYITGLGAGSLGALSMRWADDPNSGIFLNGYGRPTLAAGGVNRLEANTAGVAVSGTLTVGGNAVWHAGNLVNPASLNGAVFTGAVEAQNLTARSGTAVFLANPANTQRWYINNDDGNFRIRDFNGAQRFFMDLAGNASTGNLAVVTLASNGAITQAGNQVWHAGNLNPGNYAALSGATFTGALYGSAGVRTGPATFIGGQAQWYTSNEFGTVLTAATGTTADLVLAGRAGGRVASIPANTENFAVTNAFSVGGAANVAGALTQAGNQVWHAGNLVNPASLNGATFTGQVYGSAGMRTGPSSFTAGIAQWYTSPSLGTVITTTAGSGSDFFLANRNGGEYIVGRPNGSQDFDVGGDVFRRNTQQKYVFDGMARASSRITDGTAAPSGGSDGDMYFQYA